MADFWGNVCPSLTSLGQNVAILFIIKITFKEPTQKSEAVSESS
jgi:hypothetical protein